jgi:hypothetical protein
VSRHESACEVSQSGRAGRLNPNTRPERSALGRSDERDPPSGRWRFESHLNPQLPDTARALRLCRRSELPQCQA